MKKHNFQKPSFSILLFPDEIFFFFAVLKYIQISQKVIFLSTKQHLRITYMP